jgi:ATP-dependent Clp protease ATP-binding subunit ClpB
MLRNYHYSRTLIQNHIGKYINVSNMLSDIENSISPTPVLDWEAKNASVLEEFGRNLIKQVENNELHKIVDRDDEIQRIIQILTRQTKSNPILIGEAGVGKTAIVEKLASVLIEKKDIPLVLHDTKLYEISLSKIFSSSSQPGALEKIIEMIITTAEQENAILFIDEVHMIMTEENGKIANLLKPAMARGKIKLIGATTADEFKNFEKDKAMTRRFQPVKISEPDNISVYRILKTRASEIEEFYNVFIPEKTLLKAIALSERYFQNRKQPDKAIDLLEEAAAKLRMSLEAKPEILIELEQKLNNKILEKEMYEVKIGETPKERDIKKLQNIDKAISDLQNKLKAKEELYYEQRQLFESLIKAREEKIELKNKYKKVLHLGNFEEASRIKIELLPSINQKISEIKKQLLDFAEKTDENLIQNVVMPEMVGSIIEKATGIPVNAQDDDDLKKYRNIVETLTKEIHGQDKAIRLITDAIKRSKAGLSDKNKPLGSFLCLGPTGVGKTYLSQKLAEFMFDTDKVLHRFDMSEYMEPHSVARLFGSPPGYVGYNEGGQLTEAVKRNPYSIILFDEIEKAHTRVFDALLQILDAGRMTDGQGEVVDFKNTIIIMTSNIGSDIIREGLEHGYDAEVIETALLDEIKKHFRPEFLNRFDAKVVFNSLTPESVEKIAESELKKLINKLQEDNEIDMFYHPDIPVYITNKAYSLVDGARPVKRFINDKIIQLLTDKILCGEVEKGSNVYLRLDENKNLILFSVNDKELQELQKDEKPSEVLKLLKGNSFETADITTDKSPKKKKKKKKKKKNNWLSNSFTLNTEVGD